jgi:hypothetical protein
MSTATAQISSGTAIVAALGVPEDRARWAPDGFSTASASSVMLSKALCGAGRVGVMLSKALCGAGRVGVMLSKALCGAGRVGVMLSKALCGAGRVGA